MDCLRCEGELFVMKNGDVKIDVCVKSCGGIWFDPFELKKMNERSEIYGDFMSEIFKVGNKVIDREPRLDCPKCGIKMMRHFNSVLKKVEIDQCSQCYGHWLDGGEIITMINQFNTPEERTSITRKFFASLKSNK